MIQIEQIIVIRDPGNSSRALGANEISIDEVREFGETFFNVGFHAEIYFTDGSGFSSVKTKEGWDIMEMGDVKSITIGNLGNDKKTPLTFEAYLDLLSKEVNARNIGLN